MKIAVGGIEHETCGFALDVRAQGTPSLLDSARTLLRGDELRQLGQANTIVDGLVQGVRENGFDLVPLLWVDAITGPPASRDSLVSVVGELIERLHMSLPVDGVLLSLHGAFAVEGIDDADGMVLSRIRNLVGPDCPIMAVHDLHCNITDEMATAADVLIVERSYPHVDMAERALHAASLMARTVTGGVRPTMAVRRLPLLWSAARMIDAESPMRDAVEKLREMDSRPKLLSSSIGVGYQWIDSPAVGASAVVVTDGDAELARQTVDELTHWIWDRRDWWRRDPLTPEAALAEGERTARFPIILAEQGDNTGGGAAGDATELLRMFMERRMGPSAVLYMVDPDVARQAIAAGVGVEIEAQVGGKSQPMVGPPVPMRARVRAVSDGRFVHDGPMWAGVTAELGPSAWLEQDGVHVVVISRRHQPIDLAFCRNLGLDCRQMKYVAVKSTGHFRSGFAPIAGSIFNVDTASTLSHDFHRLPYTRLGRAMYPLDENAQLE